MCKNMVKERINYLEQISECEVVQKMKYFGIGLTMKNLDLYINTYEKLWSKLNKDLITWSKLNLSLLCQIAVIKMNLLPRIMFLLQNIPVVKDNKHWERWQKNI